MWKSFFEVFLLAHFFPLHVVTSVFLLWDGHEKGYSATTVTGVT